MWCSTVSAMKSYGLQQFHKLLNRELTSAARYGFVFVSFVCFKCHIFSHRKRPHTGKYLDFSHILPTYPQTSCPPYSFQASPVIMLQPSRQSNEEKLQEATPQGSFSRPFPTLNQSEGSWPHKTCFCPTGL